MVDRSNFQILLEPRLRKVFFDSYTEKPEQFSKVYNVKDSKKSKESDFHVAELGLWPEKDPQGSTSYEDIQPGLEVQYIHKTYSKGCRVTEEMYEDELYGVIDKMPRSIGRGGRATVEGFAAVPLNNGFTNVGYDGVSLFNDAHPLYGNLGGTCDNNTSTVLKDTSLKEMILLGRQQVNDAQIKIACDPDSLVCPEALEFTALTLLQSIQTPGTPNNDKNVINNKLKLIIMSYLTSVTAYFVFDSSMNEFNFFWRRKPRFKSDKNFDTDVAKYKGSLRFSCGYSDWRGWVGSTGTVA